MSTAVTSREFRCSMRHPARNEELSTAALSRADRVQLICESIAKCQTLSSWSSLESGRSESGPRFEAEGALATELEAWRILKAELSKPRFKRRTLRITTTNLSTSRRWPTISQAR